MAVIAPPHLESRKMAVLLTDYEKRIKRIEDGLRTGQLGNASLENASIKLKDGDGNTRGAIGPDAEGFWGFLDTNNPNPPPVPSPPNVTAGINTLIVEHGGNTADGAGFPSDLSHLNVWVAPPSGEYALAGTMNVGGNKGFPAKLPVGPLENQEYSVKVSAVNFSKKESDRSTAATATPNLVVGQDILNGIIDETKLAAESVTEASLAAQAVTKTKVADNAIDTPQLVAGSVKADKIAAGQIQSSHIVTGSITAEKIAALSITTDKIAANAIESGKIAAGAVTANKLDADLVIAGRIIAGDAAGARVELNASMGIQAFKDDATVTFWLDSLTGSAFFMGEVITAPTGNTRIQINTGGAEPDVIRFYQSNGTYGYINAEPGAGGTAAIVMRSSPANRGQVGAYGAEAYVGWFQGAETTARAAAAAQSDRLNLWGGSIFLDSRTAYSNGFIEFTQNGNVNSLLRHFFGNSSPNLVRPSNSGFLFATNAIGVTNGTATTNGPIVATAFNPPSSETLKEGISEIAYPDGRSSWDIIEGAPSQDWYYTAEDVLGPERKKHRFPLAEDIAAIEPNLVSPGVLGGPDDIVVDMRDMIGVLWDAVDMLIKRNRLLETRLAIRLPAMQLPSRPQKGDLIAGIGALIQGRTRRDIDPDTGQIRNRIRNILGG